MKTNGNPIFESEVNEGVEEVEDYANRVDPHDAFVAGDGEESKNTRDEEADAEGDILYP